MENIDINRLKEIIYGEIHSIYSIHKATGLNQSNLNKYRKKQIPLESMTIGTAYKIIEYADSVDEQKANGVWRSRGVKKAVSIYNKVTKAVKIYYDVDENKVYTYTLNSLNEEVDVPDSMILVLTKGFNTRKRIKMSTGILKDLINKELKRQLNSNIIVK